MKFYDEYFNSLDVPLQSFRPVGNRNYVVIYGWDIAVPGQLVLIARTGNGKQFLTNAIDYTILIDKKDKTCRIFFKRLEEYAKYDLISVYNFRFLELETQYPSQHTR